MGFFKSLLGAVVATAVSFVIPGAAAFAWPLFMQRVAVNFALGYLSQALTPKPQELAAAELADNTVTSKNSIAPRKLVYGVTRIGGTIVYMQSSGTNNAFLHVVIAMATHRIQSFEEIYFDDEKVWDGGSYIGDWGDYLDINTHIGSPTQTYDTQVAAVSDGKWTEDHKLSGVAYLAVRLKYDRDKFANGIPNISALVYGRRVWTGATTEFSNNPAWCLRDYLTDVDYGMGIDPSELDDTSFAEAASVCDEVVASQTNYLLDGVVDLSKQRSTIIEEMLTSMGGVLTYSGGKFYLHASKYYTPTVTFTESELTSEIQVDTRRSRRSLYNGVKGVFASANDKYQPTDYPPMLSDTYELEDGDPLYLDLNLPFTTNPKRAQRLAKLVLLQGRQQISANLQLNMSGLKVKVGDFIKITNTSLGWDEKEFRITNYGINLGETITVDISVIETSAAIYDWQTSDETDYVAGLATTLPAYNSVQAPSNLVQTAGALVQEDGTVLSYIELTWDENDAFVAHYEVQYKKTTETRYKSVFTNNAFFILEGLEAGATYDIRVRAVNRLGAKSLFVSGSLLSASDETAPSAPTSVTATGSFEAITIQWTNPTVKDLRRIQIWESADSNSANATLIAYASGSEFYRANLGVNVTKYYWLKSEDYTGNISGFSSVASGTTTFVDDAAFEDGIRQLFLDQGLDIIEPVATLPASGVFTGQQVFNTADGKLYQWSGSAWILVIADVADTSITGAKIATGTIEAGNIKANTITGGLLATSGIITDSAQINDSLITNAKIANLAVDTAQIADLAVDTAKIDDLAVETIKIADQAVTIPSSVFDGSDATNPLSNNEEWTVETLTATSSGADISVTIAACIQLDNSVFDLAAGTYNLFMNLDHVRPNGSTATYNLGNVCQSVRAGTYNAFVKGGGAVSFPIKVFAPSGSNTYKIRFKGTKTGSSTPTYRITSRGIVALEVKK